MKKNRKNERLVIELKRKGILSLFLFLVFVASSWAQARYKINGEQNVTSWISTHFAKGKVPPFSFVYGGKHSSELIKKWAFTSKRESDDNKMVKYLFTWRDPATGLLTECSVKGFKEFQTVEWVINFTNTSSKNTPILREVKAIDYIAEYPTAEVCNVLHIEGTHFAGTRADFRPHLTPIEADKPLQLYPDLIQGRSSDEGCSPFFNIIWGGKQGIVAALGWTGTWVADFSKTDSKSVGLAGGMKFMNLTLYPGETIRTPSVCLLFWKGEDLMTGQNKFRRFVLAHHSRTIDGKFAEYPISVSFSGSDPTPCTENCCSTEDYLLALINRHKMFGVIPEVFWLDAGWYKGCGFYEGGYAWQNVGSWVPDPVRYPNGLKPVADAAHALGSKFLLWFEIERVNPDSKLALEHPEFMSHRPDRGYFLYDFGNPKAVEYISQYVGDFIETTGIDVYRQDACIYPAYWWRANDTIDRKHPSDRIGISEIRHIEGLYRYWDNLLKRFPKLLIDNCAGGGARLDLEMISRSASLWRSDYQPGEPNGYQCHAYGLNMFLPIHGTGTFSTDKYHYRSSLSAATVFSHKVTRSDVSVPDMKNVLEQFKKYRPYYYEDYYPLTGFNDLTGDDVWLAYQLNRPSDDTGIVLAFRRPKAVTNTISVSLKGLKPNQKYALYDEDTDKTVVKTGAELAAGLTLKSDPAPGSLFLYYKAVD